MKDIDVGVSVFFKNKIGIITSIFNCNCSYPKSCHKFVVIKWNDGTVEEWEYNFFKKIIHRQL